MKKKKTSVKEICNNILMVCAALTALSGVAGNMKGLFETEKEVQESSKTIIIEQRIQGNHNGPVSKTFEIPPDAMQPVTTSAYAPEETQISRGLWITLLVTGIIGIVVSILFKKMMKKEETDVK